MATFAKSTYSASSYAAFRPSYPESLYQSILSYHQGPRTLCLDLGCGHGLVTRALSSYFSHTIGVDPSRNMLKETEKFPQSNIEYRQGAAENLHFVRDGSVDMVVAGQAAHWFDQSRLFPELKRVMRKGGTLAFWGYKDFIFVNYPRSTEILRHYSTGHGPDLLGDYWAQPGRSIVENKLREIHPPETEWEETRRIEFEPDPNQRSGEVLMSKTMTLGDIRAYVRTWSAYHAWREAHPGVKSAEEGGSGDVVDQLFERMLDVEDSWKQAEPDWRSVEVMLEWGTGVVMARKK